MKPDGEPPSDTGRGIGISTVCDEVVKFEYPVEADSREPPEC